MDHKILKMTLTYGIVLLFLILSFIPISISQTKEYTKESLKNENEVDISNLTIFAPMKTINDLAWPMQGYNKMHIGRSPYSTEDNPGIEKWRFPVTDWCEGSPVIDDDGVIYFGGDDFLHALYLNGTLKWKYQTEWSIGSFGISPAIGDDGTIYFGQKFGDWLYALNPDGTKKWKYQTGEIFTSITLDDNGVLYYGLGNRLDARYPNASLKWSYYTGNYVESTPAIDENGIIYFGSHNNYVYALYPNGAEKWSFQTGGWVHGSPTVGEDGTVYVGSDDTNLYALYPTNGTMKWSCNVGSMRGSPSLDKDGNLYFGVWENKIYSISPEGAINWEFPIGDHDGVWGSTVAISDDGTAYIGCNINIGTPQGGEIIALDLNGNLKWRKIISDRLVTSSPAIGENGDVYICSSQSGGGPDAWGYLHAFGTQESNVPPVIPSIDGLTEGEVGTRYIYHIRSDDPDNNPISYFVDWGDGNTYGWTRDYEPGLTVSYGHTWQEEGGFTIKVKSKDTFGLESDWAYLEVTMPVNQPVQNYVFPFLQQLFNRFPNAFPILRQLLGL